MKKILFGDLHQHTADSDGCGDPESLWIAARERRSLDFAAITDHDRFCRRAIGPATWAAQVHIADAFDEPGNFAAIHGYEFTGPRHPGPGHKCIYFGERVPERVPDKEVDHVLGVVRELGGIAVPHHIGWTGADFEHHSPVTQPVWEICSVHGCYEREGGCGFPPRDDLVLPGHFIVDALEAGHRFGLIGSTDSHGLLWHHGITPKRDPFSTGLAAVVGARLERRSVLEALRSRRCYATTGPRIELHLDFEGAPMGSELPADAIGRLGIEVQAPGPINRVEIVGRELELLLPHSGASATGSASIPALQGAWDYWYVRVILESGDLAWSSPFWRGPAPQKGVT
jgi:hypothetical protein